MSGGPGFLCLWPTVIRFSKQKIPLLEWAPATNITVAFEKMESIEVQKQFGYLLLRNGHSLYRTIGRGVHFGDPPARHTDTLFGR